MIRALVEQTFDSTKKYYVLAGLSTDSKPTSGVITGSKFLEVDTGVNYAFDEVNNQWTAFTITEQEIKDEIDAWLDEHPEATTTVEDGAISYAKLNAELQGKVDDIGTNTEAIAQLQSGKADKDGSYIDLTAGNAEFLLSDRGDTDIAPYVFRKTGGEKKAYNREMLKKIVGGTVAWNQLAPETNDKTKWYPNKNTLSNDGNILVCTMTEASASASIAPSSGAQIPTFPAGHRVLYKIEAFCEKATRIRVFYDAVAYTKSLKLTANTWGVLTGITKITAATRLSVYLNIDNDLSFSDVVKFKNIYAIDLTQMFGSTIAEAIYAMELATAGSGVAFFRSLFPNDYYAYDAGTLMSVQAKEHRTVGFNQFPQAPSFADTNTNLDKSIAIRVITGETYQFTFDQIGSATSWRLPIRVWDSDGNLITTGKPITAMDGSNNANVGYSYSSNSKTWIEGGNSSRKNTKYTFNIDGYIKVMFALGDTSSSMTMEKACFHFAGYRDGEYEPYKEHVYPLDSDLVLRGIPKLDSDGNLYYDGDEYTADGTVTRKYGSRAYESGDESLADAITDGTTTVYKLTTPTTEQADPYHEIQICNRYGTEEFVDAGVTASTPTRDVSIPVGTDTFYPVNVFDYIEELTQPDHDMVADANIASGKYFMVGNSLYLSTEAIEQGAAIVPGTNCTAVSLAEALNTINT